MRVHNDYLIVLTVCTALGCALNGGIFFAFSAFIMKALSRLPPAHGIAAMQAINVVAVTPVFMTALFGTAAACLVLIVSTLLETSPGSRYLIAGSVSYLAGTVLVTIVFNVPRNNALARVDGAGADGARVWRDYLRSWTAWNHVRTAAALVAAGLQLAGLLRAP